MADSPLGKSDPRRASAAQGGKTAPSDAGLKRAMPLGFADPAIPAESQPMLKNIAALRAGAQQRMRAKSQQAKAEQEEQPGEEEEEPTPWREMFDGSSSWIFSGVFHMILAIVLGLIFVDVEDRFAKNSLTAALAEEEPLEEEEELFEEPEPEFEAVEITDEQPNELQFDSLTSELELVDDLNPEEGVDAAAPELIAASDLKAILSPVTIPDGTGTGEAKEPGAGKGDKGTGKGALGTGTGLGGRAARRGSAIGKGATKESEDAVNAALKWLADHQYPDGSWSFEHRGHNCQGRCANPGTAVTARNGATGLALLPFLGAGQTHLHGKYKRTVGKGLYFLINNMRRNGRLGSFWEKDGTLYSHGIATLALCEAWAMSQEAPVGVDENASLADKPVGKNKKNKAAGAQWVHSEDIGRAAQMALNYIMGAQGPRGGWRYEPLQAGDTSVVGWQVMALKSGHMARLKIAPKTVAGASKWLDFVQSDVGDYGGSNYGYTGANKGTDATQAIGLLCRMFLGWDRDNRALVKGVQEIAAKGPSKSDMYFNYYATQVVHHHDGLEWKKWNPKMRNQLVGQQAKNGHETGSWYFDHHHGQKGGRLYSTAMAAVTLQVYYRFSPIYKKKAVGNRIEKAINGG